MFNYQLKKKIVSLSILSFYFVLAFSQVKTKEAGLKLSKTIVLPKVKGGFDLMAADITGKRLFVSA